MHPMASSPYRAEISKDPCHDPRRSTDTYAMDPRTRDILRLWTQAQPAVSAFALALLRNASERDEAMQMTAVAIVDAFDSYDPARPFLPWALGIARREIATLRRRSSRVPILSDAAERAIAAALPELAEAERARLAHLADCLAKLEGRAREICDLRYRSDLKPGRIAELLGLRPNTVAKSLERIRDELRACIERASNAEMLA